MLSNVPNKRDDQETSLLLRLLAIRLKIIWSCSSFSIKQDLCELATLCCEWECLELFSIIDTLRVELNF